MAKRTGWNGTSGKSYRQPVRRRVGKPVGTIDLDAEGQWRGVFEGVPKYSGSGDEISYTVGETPVENYTSAYSETAVGGWIITNTYNVPTPPADPSPAVVNIRASKTLDGARLWVKCSRLY